VTSAGRRRLATGLVTVALLLAGCSHPLAARVASGTTRASGRTASRVASLAASAVADALAAAEPTGTPVVQLDPAPFLGRPVLRGPATTDAVAITMDDGPSKNTAAVLSIFRRKGARCTFFYIGNRIPRYRALMRGVAASGFEVGDHTWDHQEVKRESRAFDLSEIDRGREEIARETGIPPVFFRPPAGHYDATGLRAVADRGMVMMLWSLHGHDTGPGTHAEVIARGVLASVRPGDVILLHETNSETVRALPLILDGLRAKRLRPVTLSELLAR
jgi:peptidoglycan-N-acetylglucosamine deacetylase